jgi:protein tyrosine phosphatase
MIKEALSWPPDAMTRRYLAATRSHQDMVRAGEVLAGATPINLDKNRYGNICPYDARRVVLRRPGPSDYINASHIEVPHVRAIAAQGPTHPDWYGADTTGDFWSAVWEHGVEVVVALANVQPGFSGSARYWPQAVGNAATTRGSDPELVVTLISEEAGPHFTTRRLRLSQSIGNARDVLQLHYTNWPNYGTPENTNDVAMLLRTVEKMESTRLAGGAVGPAPPILVHCSGGVGRTGVFLTALSVYRTIFPTVPSGSLLVPIPLADAEALADLIAETLASLRKQRHPWMVEGSAQYAFAHAVIVHECEATVRACSGQAVDGVNDRNCAETK